jgi:hypothetical protein
VNIIDNIDVQIIIANVMLHTNLQVLFHFIALALILTTKLKAMYHHMVFVFVLIKYKDKKWIQNFKGQEHLSEQCYHQCKFTLQFNRIKNGICD